MVVRSWNADFYHQIEKNNFFSKTILKKIKFFVILNYFFPIFSYRFNVLILKINF
jgi:hypothetical protein